MESKRKNLRKNRGITLVALVITIIILLILAGISIAQLTGTGIFAKAEEAKQKYKEAEDLENQILANYEAQLNRLGKSTVGSGDGTGGSGEHSGGEGEQGDQPKPSGPTEPATNMEEAKKDDMYEKTVNSPVQDVYGNQVVVPAGFKITEDASNVTEGIVIIDEQGNEFVWIPVGEIKTKEQEQKKIELNRYTFDTSGVPTKQDNKTIEDYCQELSSSSYGNTVAKNLEEFKTSATTNHGYYIGRYEGRDGITTSARTSSTSDENQLVCKADAYVYNYVTQPQASQLCQEMYSEDSNFTSDLMNSYAWDTAIVFLQTFGDNKTYSRKTSVNSSLAKTGTNNTETQDVECNIYDMASNMWEWTTETCTDSYTCLSRGGVLGNSNSYTSDRHNSSTTHSNLNFGFRPLLYCSTES